MTDTTIDGQDTLWDLAHSIHRAEPAGHIRPAPVSEPLIDSTGTWDLPPWEQVEDESLKRFEARKALPFGDPLWVHPASTMGTATTAGVLYTGTHGSWPGGYADPMRGRDYQGILFIVAFFLFFFVAPVMIVLFHP